MKLLGLAGSTIASLLLAGCIAVPGAPPPVPPVQAERIPAPPASAITLIWQPGHWDWDGQDYTWSQGQWVPRAGHGPLWQDGFWRRAGSGYSWVPAHWL